MVYGVADDAASVAEEFILAGVEPAPADLAGARNDGAIVAGQRITEEIADPAGQDVDVAGPTVLRWNRGLVGQADPQHVAGERRVGLLGCDTPAHDTPVAIGPDHDITAEHLVP